MTQTEIAIDEDGTQLSITRDASGTVWLTLGPKGVSPWAQATTGVRLCDAQELITRWERTRINNEIIKYAATRATYKLEEIRRLIRENKANLLAGPFTRALLIDLLHICETYARDNSGLRNTLQRAEQALAAAQNREAR